MATTIANEFHDYFTSLPATSNICVALGGTFTTASNLYIGDEPEVDECLSIFMSGGGPPDIDGYRQEPEVQLRLKSNSRRTALSTMQSIINTLHHNTRVCSTSRGKVFANQSAPFIFGVREGGEFVISIANFSVKHMKF